MIDTQPAEEWKWMIDTEYVKLRVMQGWTTADAAMDWRMMLNDLRTNHKDRPLYWQDGLDLKLWIRVRPLTSL